MGVGTSGAFGLVRTIGGRVAKCEAFGTLKGGRCRRVGGFTWVRAGENVEALDEEGINGILIGRDDPDKGGGFVCFF